jgi:hypothetical protein
MDRVTRGMSKAGHDPNHILTKREGLMSRMMRACKDMAAGVVAMMRGRKRVVR